MFISAWMSCVCMVPSFLHEKAVDFQLFPLSWLGWLVTGLSLFLHGRVNDCCCSLAGNDFLSGCSLALVHCFIWWRIVMLSSCLPICFLESLSLFSDLSVFIFPCVCCFQLCNF